MDLSSPYGYNSYHHPQSFSHLGATTPHTPREDISQFGNVNTSNFLPSGTNGNLPAPPRLTPSILPDSVEPLKEDVGFYDESLYNRHCKEEQQCLPSITKAFNVPENPDPYQAPIPSGIETHVAQNDNCFTNAENSGYSVQVPSSMEGPSTKGLFGMLPHEEVMSRNPPLIERNDNFIPPVAVAVPVPISPVVVPSTVPPTHNNTPYSEANGDYSPANAPQSVQSTISADTTSCSPPAPPQQISNFSSPSEYFPSPKGVNYNTQSPACISPSAAKHPVPTSPFAMEDMNHITPTPCSPIGTATFPNNMPHHQRPSSQHSPVPPQNFINNVGAIPHPAQTSQHNSATNFAGAVPQHPGQSSQHNSAAMTQNFASNMGGLPPHPQSALQPTLSSGVGFTNNMNGMPHSTSSNMDPVMSYGSSQSQNMPCHRPPSVLSKPEYPEYDMYAPAPSPYPSTFQASYPSTSCQVPASQYRTQTPGIAPQLPQRYNGPPMMNPMMSNHNEMGYVPSKHDMDMYSNRMEPPIHNHNASSNIPNFLDKNLPVLDTDMFSNRQPHPSTFPDTFSRTRPVKQEIINDGYGPSVFDNSFNKYNSMDYNVRPYRARRARRPRGSYTPRRRGRRGRRRKAEFFSDISRPLYRDDCTMSSAIAASELINFGDTENLNNTISDRMCDQNELPPSYSYGRYRSELKTECSQKKIESSLFKPADNAMGLFNELKFVPGVSLPNRRLTRNQRIRDTPFIGKFHQFLSNWSARQSSDEVISVIIPSKEIKPINPEIPPELPVETLRTEEKEEKNDLHELKLVFVRHPKKQWHVERKTTSSRSKSRNDSQSASQLSSHKIKIEIESEEESDTGNLPDSNRKLRSKKSVGHSNKLNDIRELLLLTNFDRLSAGKRNSESVKDSMAFEDQPIIQKRRGRKKKKTLEETLTCATDSKDIKSESTDTLPSAYPVKKEPVEGDFGIQVISSRRSSLRQRKTEEFPIEPVPGPSFSRETIDVSSDGYENYDDSDSDPAWMPGSKNPKGSDNLKPLSMPCPIKKRGPRASPKASSPTSKKRRKSSGSSKKRECKRSADALKKETSYSRRKKDKEPGHYLIAKADLDLSAPHLWKVDPKTSMLQRFDVCEQNGVTLYKESFTYAAYNETSASLYVTAKVNVLNDAPLQHKVEYLGPNLAESAEVLLLKHKIPSPRRNKSSAASQNLKEGLNASQPNLIAVKENFEVYIQSLISQSLDNSFLSEINRENDVYFLSSIREIESVSEEKKEKFMNEDWNDEFMMCLDSYPTLEVSYGIRQDLNCEACCQKMASKLMKFGGQPYDCTTLGEVGALQPTKREFYVCVSCSISSNLYNRLHHQKYNFFVKCHAKMMEAKGDSEELVSHALLEKCLRDHVWISQLFDELIQSWHADPRDR